MKQEATSLSVAFPSSLVLIPNVLAATSANTFEIPTRADIVIPVPDSSAARRCLRVNEYVGNERCFEF